MSDTLERPAGIQTRSLPGAFTRIRAEGEAADDAVRFEFIASTDGPVEMWRGMFEILDHSPNAVRAGWFQSGNAPVLWMHDRNDQRGVVASAKVEDNKLKVVVRMSSSETKLIKDIEDGIIRNVSVGYRIHDEKIDKRDIDPATGQTLSTTWRVTDWEPKEVSFVSIPADPAAGFRDDEGIKSRVRFLEQKAQAESPSPSNRTMSTPTETATISVTEHEKARTDAVTAERLRVAGITAAASRAKETHMGDFGARAQEAIDKGESLADFQSHVLSNMKRTDPVTTRELGLTDKEAKRFSLLNILDGLREGKPELYAFEREVSEAARAANQHRTNKGEVCIPTDILLRGWFPKDPAVAARMGLTDRERTLISVSASTADSSNLVPAELMADAFIQSLREDQVLLSECTMLPGLVGDVDIPIELLNPTFYWVGEDVEPTDGVWTASQIAFRFKTIAARISITRRSLKQTTPNIEGVIAANLRRGAALGIEARAFFGTASSTAPGGILSTAGIGSVTSSGTLTFAQILELRSDVASANAHGVGSKFYTSSKGVSRMRGCGFVANDAKRVAEYENGVLYCEGRQVCETNLIPDTISTNKSAILYGDPRTVYVGMWGGLELGVDMATKAATAGKVLRAFQDVDIQVPQPAFWSAIQDLT